MSDYTRHNSTANSTSSSTSNSNCDTSTLEWANSFAECSALSSHIMSGGKLEIGDRGPEVEDLQRMLGFNNVDGVFGPMTFQQLSLFQGAFNMQATGVLDLQTYSKMSHTMTSGTNRNAILFGQVGQGASSGTAWQDRLPGGQASSIKMAQNDEDRVLQYQQAFEHAAMRYNIPAAVLAAIASRETRGGSQLNDEGYSIYGGNLGFGLMQVDGGHHDPAGAATSMEHIEQAAGILVSFRERLRDRHPDWSEPQLLKAAVSAYNCGPGRINSVANMDGYTTGGDYSNDTWVRAQYYARFFGSTGPTA